MQRLNLDINQAKRDLLLEQIVTKHKKLYKIRQNQGFCSFVSRYYVC